MLNTIGERFGCICFVIVTLLWSIHCLPLLVHFIATNNQPLNQSAHKLKHHRTLSFSLLYATLNMQHIKFHEIVLDDSVVCFQVSSPGGALNLTVFLCWSIGTMYNFFNSALIGPGYAPEQWKPVCTVRIGTCHAQLGPSHQQTYSSKNPAD